MINLRCVGAPSRTATLLLLTQTSSIRMAVQQRAIVSRLSSNDLPEGTSLAATLSAPGGGGGGGGRGSGGQGSVTTGTSSGGGGVNPSPCYVASKLSGSAPVVPSNPRPQSGIRVPGTGLLRTLMENGASIIGEIDRASNHIGFVESKAGMANLTEEHVRRRHQHQHQHQHQQPGLTDAARRSIVRRRSALKMTSSSTDDNPLSTSTWGLFDNHRGRGESKSFTLRRNNSPTAGNVKRVGTERQLERTAVTQSQNEFHSVTATASSLNSGNGSTKKRPPSRLMSFLANKNIAGAPVGGGHPARSLNLGGVNQVWSSSLVSDVGVTAGAAVSMLKGVSSTTELELGSRQGSSLGRSGMSVLTMQHLTNTVTAMEAAVTSTVAGESIGNLGGVNGVGTAAANTAASGTQAASPRRPPTRRVLRPAVEDVAEESGAECSGRLQPLSASARESGCDTIVTAGALPHLSAVMQAARASSSSQATSRMPTAGQLLSPSQMGPASERESGAADDDDDDDCWHEITASTLRDPVNGEQAILLMQVDVSARVRAERRIAEVLEAEHKLLESVFPRHVLELAATRRPKNASGRPGVGPMSKFSLAELPLAQNCASVATYHPMVTILFSDIIGFTSMCHEIPATKVMEFLNNLYSRLGGCCSCRMPDRWCRRCCRCLRHTHTRVRIAVIARG
ncbi:hypothetical protein Vafri_17712 [Volvox africanus]|uniref:Guanylate cyclase domain-containing protein n=1 Tax=Volvox africanus TaxID=51714 RepID=A0A8J4BLK6_9CHLO|nr:hypothetical protein Vafri_17712 [Volvox africanus]